MWLHVCVCVCMCAFEAYHRMSVCKKRMWHVYLRLPGWLDMSLRGLLLSAQQYDCENADTRTACMHILLSVPSCIAQVQSR